MKESYILNIYNTDNWTTTYVKDAFYSEFSPGTLKYSKGRDIYKFVSL